jgi:hypothetical protein
VLLRRLRPPRRLRRLRPPPELVLFLAAEVLAGANCPKLVIPFTSSSS